MPRDAPSRICGKRLSRKYPLVAVFPIASARSTENREGVQRLLSPQIRKDDFLGAGIVSLVIPKGGLIGTLFERTAHYLVANSPQGRVMLRANKEIIYPRSPRIWAFDTRTEQTQLSHTGFLWTSLDSAGSSLGRTGNALILGVGVWIMVSTSWRRAVSASSGLLYPKITISKTC
jgi:hypothetical protein